MLKTPFVVGIGGGSCGGKTTFTRNIEETLTDLSLEVMHCDKYYRNPSIQRVSPYTGVRYKENNLPESLRQEELFADFAEKIAPREDAPDIVIIEGLFVLYWDVIRTNLDLKLFVDLQSDERIIRRVARHAPFEGAELAANRYLDLVRYRHDQFIEPSRWLADMVINGNHLNGVTLDIICGYIRQQVAARNN